MNRTSALKRTVGLKRSQKGFAPRRSKLRLQGVSTASQLKRDIQALVRAIVILRDGRCILREVNNYDFLEGGKIGIARKIAGVPRCNGFAKDGHLILQADHLISRSNSATYGDTRLIVCLCKAHHGWKSVGNNLRKAEYDKIVRQIISPERVALWDMAEADKYRPHKMDWALVKVGLEQEYKRLLK